METRKRYYEDSHLSRFNARVLSCEPGEGGFRVILDATAFYPEGGGQAADTGTLGNVRVLDTREEGEWVIHLCDGPLTPGESVEGVIDYDARFYRMQQHSGEHIISGIICRRYGCSNTGFHLGSDMTTIDFDAVIPADALPEIEAEANRAVWQNLPVVCSVPSPEQLPSVTYRSKRRLPWPVRIVEISGYDSCACCGTHVAATGEIGIIKLFTAVPCRGGTRIEMACGAQALLHLNRIWEQNRLVCREFSAMPHQTGEAARKVNQTLTRQKGRIVALEREIFRLTAREYAGKDRILHFHPELDSTGIRELADILADTGGTAAVFSGSDGDGYGFCLASRGEDLRQLTRDMIQALQGRGGGKPGFQQGRVAAHRGAIESFFRQAGF